MQGPEDGTQVLNLFETLFHPFFVTVETGHVESVRTAHIKVPIAVEIAQSGTLRFRHHRAQTEFLAHHPNEWEWDSIGVGDTQVGEAVPDIIFPGDRFCAVGLKKAGE